MRLVRILVALLAATLANAGVRAAEDTGHRSMAINAMTFNIRVDVATDAANAWPHRKDLVAALIRYEAPDIIGLQEVLLHQKRDLERALPDYAFVGVGRDDGKDAGEFTPLAYSLDRFELIESGTFWLSSTPAVPDKGWDAVLPRIATWVVLRERASGRLIRVLNTHFDHVGAQAKTSSATLIGRWVTSGQRVELPAIVMGDFNAAPGSEPYRLLADIAAANLTDTRSISRTPAYGPRGTFTGFRIERDAPGAIDHIFVTPDFVVESHAVITQHWGGRLPSDHYPVMAELRLVSP